MLVSVLNISVGVDGGWLASACLMRYRMGREFGGVGQKEDLSVGEVKLLWSIPLELEQIELKTSC